MAGNLEVGGTRLTQWLNNAINDLGLSAFLLGYPQSVGSLPWGHNMDVTDPSIISSNN